MQLSYSCPMWLSYSCPIVVLLLSSNCPLIVLLLSPRGSSRLFTVPLETSGVKSMLNSCSQEIALTQNAALIPQPDTTLHYSISMTVFMFDFCMFWSTRKKACFCMLLFDLVFWGNGLRILLCQALAGGWGMVLSYCATESRWALAVCPQLARCICAMKNCSCSLNNCNCSFLENCSCSF